ncbi:MAG TPA: hypothetical protein VGB83_01825 [Actinomycetota bacterium]
MVQSGSLIARFDEPEHVRKALQSLSRAGVDGVQASLIGPSAARAEIAIERETATADRREMKWLLPRVVAGAVAGMGLAALLGALLAGILSIDAGLALIIGLVAAGALVGAYAGGVLALPLNDDFELTFADWDGEAIYLEVTVPSHVRDRVGALLDELGAERLTRR